MIFTEYPFFIQLMYVLTNTYFLQSNEVVINRDICVFYIINSIQ